MTKASPKPAIEDITEDPKQTSPETAELFRHFGRFSGDFAGIILIALALMIVLGYSSSRLSNGLLDIMTRALRLWFGWGGLWFAAAFGSLGVIFLRRHTSKVELNARFWVRVFSFEAAALSSIALLSIVGGADLLRAEAGLDGGRVGWGLAEVLRLFLATIGLQGASWMIGFMGIILLMAVMLGMGGFGGLRRWSQTAYQAGRGFVEDEPAVVEAPLQGSAQPKNAQTNPKRKLPLPPQFRKNFRVEPAQKPINDSSPRDPRLPGFDLLVNEQFNRPDERNINLTAGLIEKTLAEFGIPAKVVGFQVGPTVTQFAVEPGYLSKETQGIENGEADATESPGRTDRRAEPRSISCAGG